ncbi:MAG: chromosome segregation protein SMC [Candidatus Marsarchaeota archaeon]|nr:chromosome segregation protein SMC [Candidatus Marsarchaeota archaeon]MCL5413136.1 chromosome segregation protein SMC [Candidatus Marsarchaeota archaeon]
MLYLKSLIIDKFKSFRHAELLFSKGFNCVVGPNGSGKSVIFDSMMFDLGEPSLSALRVDGLSELINRNMKKRSGEPLVAHVKMEFEGDGQNITIIKSVNSDSKTHYKLNGKTMTRREVIEVLSSNGVKVDDTTTIAQGMINQIAQMNSKDRRSLIDTAVGIRDFEYKKSEALKELDKVEQNISVANAQLNERQGFLNELEKEKEAAEKWNNMKQRLTSLRYSILLARQAELQESLDVSAKEIKLLNSRKSEVSGKLAELNNKRTQLSGEREAMTAQLNKISSTSGETNAKLENLSRELAKLEVEMPALQRSIEDRNAFILQSGQELALANEKITSNTLSVDELTKKVAVLEAGLAKLGILYDGADFQKDLKELDGTISEHEGILTELEVYMQKLQSDLSNSESRKSESEKKLSDIGNECDRMLKLTANKEEELRSARLRLTDNAATIAKLTTESSKAKQRLSEIDLEQFRLMEQRAAAQSREGGLLGKISDKFGEKDGFYGKASRLCQYDVHHACAVEVAASSRFDYFVVESIDIGTKIIDYLKQNNMGRATFIPLSELNPEKQQKEKGLIPILDIVKYNEKFAKAFSYIFNNTYLIDSSGDAKKYGIGKHRYVTLEGELIEQSGVISGGSSRRISLAAIEGRLADLDAEKSKLRKGAELIAESLRAAEKERYLVEAQISGVAAAIKAAKDDLGNMLKLQSELNVQIKSCSVGISKIRDEMSKKDRERLEIASALNSHRESRSAVYDKMNSALNMGRSAKFKEEKAMSEKMRDDIEGYKIARAELNKEMQMLEQKSSELSTAVSSAKNQLKQMKSDLRDKEVRKGLLAKSRSELEKEISGRNESTKNAFETVTSLDTELASLGNAIGSLSSDTSNIDRQISELGIKRGNSETRFNDIAAELSTYDKSLIVVKDKIPDMELEANTLQVRITELGNVNLRAPELYEERKKLTEEARSRVDTLHNEKDAVLRMIEEIDSKKLQTFMEMLNEVNKNFTKLYNQVFPGKGTIMLDDEKDPLNSGLYIKMTDGKLDIPLKSLSGGQKSIIALMLLFSIHQCKKSSLYLFDEVDAALDSENAKILSRLIKEMSKDAQFVVISHNNSLIVNADTAIGVAMDESKESNAVGLDISSMMANK